MPVWSTVPSMATCCAVGVRVVGTGCWVLGVGTWYWVPGPVPLHRSLYHCTGPCTHCTGPYCTGPYCTGPLYWTSLYWTLLYWTSLYRTSLYCTPLYRTHCTVPTLLTRLTHPLARLTLLLPAIVPPQPWRLPQPQDQCSKRLSIPRSLRTFEQLN